MEAAMNNIHIDADVKEKVISFVQSVTIALGIALFLFFFVVVPSEVEGQSMEPTFYSGERLYTDRLPHWFNGTTVGNILSLNYKRGDVIVLQKPGMEALIKRIIGMPGETIEIKNGYFYIDGTRLEEPYLDNSVTTHAGSFLGENSPMTIPNDSYFVAGDNRSVSNDSRYFGFVKTDWIIGKPFIRIWPISRISTL